MTSRRPTPPERPSTPPSARGRGRGATPLRAPRSGGQGPRDREARAAGPSGAQRDTGRPTREERPASTERRRPHVPWAFAHGVMSAVAMAVAVLVPVLLGWMLDAKTTAGWNEAFAVSIDVWALAHRARVESGGVTVVFSPLLLTVLCILAARIGVRLALPRTRVAWSDLRLILAAFVGGYVLGAQLLGILSSLGSSHISWWSLILGPAAVAVAGVVWALVGERKHSPEVATLSENILDRVPLLLVRSVRSARRGLLLFGLLSLLALAVLLAWHGGRIWAIHQQLHPGTVGGIVLILGQLLALPNLTALLSAWTAGSAIHVGAVTIGHDSMTPGTLPMIPVLGALPDGGVGPWTWAALALPIAVGGFIGWDAAGSVTKLSSVRAKIVVAACAAAVATVAMWVLWWFSSARVSQGLLDGVHPSWEGWALLPALLVLPAVLVAAVRHWMVNHRH